MPEASIELTNAQLASVAQGLAGLDGLSTKPGEFTPFVFDVETVWLIADNASFVSAKLAAYERANRMLSSSHKIPMGQIQVTMENAKKVAAFMRDLNALKERKVPVAGLKRIPRAALKVGHEKGQNPIPPGVLTKLMPILE